MTNYYFFIIYIVPLISVDGQASPRLFIAPEIRHEKISYYTAVIFGLLLFSSCSLLFVILVIYTEYFSLVRNHCVLCILRKFFMHGQLFHA